MGREVRVLCLVIAIAAAFPVFAPPASAAMPAPRWTVGDSWTYWFSGVSPFGPAENGTIRFVVSGTGTARVNGTDYPSWALATTINITWAPPSFFWENTSGTSWFRTSDLAFVRQDVTGLSTYPGFGSAPVTTNITWAPPQDRAWPLAAGATWATQGLRENWVDVSWTEIPVAATFLARAEQSTTVPAGTFPATRVDETDTDGNAYWTAWSGRVGNVVAQRALDAHGLAVTYELTSYRYQFMEGDTAPPSIAGLTATPRSRRPGGSMNLSATITDDTFVAGAYVNVTLPDGSHANASMTQGAGDLWSYNRTFGWGPVGVYHFVVWASDPTGKWASASGGSFVVDSAPPTITHTPPGPANVGDAIQIRANVTDDDRVQEVRLVYTPVGGAEENVTMTLSGGVYAYTIPGQSGAGTVTYHIYAVDAAGTATATNDVQLTIQATGLSPALLYGIIGIVILVVVIAAAAALGSRRKWRQAQPPTNPPP